MVAGAAPGSAASSSCRSAGAHEQVARHVCADQQPIVDHERPATEHDDLVHRGAIAERGVEALDQSCLLG
jgi:hypothetical protein